MNLTFLNLTHRQILRLNTHILSFLCIGLFFLLSSCSNTEKSTPEQEDNPDVVEVAEDDPAMNNAIAKAKSTFGEFKAHLQENGGNPQYNYSVKKPFPTAHDGLEHIWITDVELVDGKYHGIIGNEPIDVPEYQLNQEVVTEGDEISDWMILDDATSTAKGGFTIRVLRDQMTEEERAEFDSYSGFEFE